MPVEIENDSHQTINNLSINQPIEFPDLSEDNKNYNINKYVDKNATNCHFKEKHPSHSEGDNIIFLVIILVLNR